MPLIEGTRDPQLAAERVSFSDLAAQYQVMLTKLDAIQADMVTLSNHATTLSTITVANLAAVQAVLRSLGSDLVTLTDDMNALAVGSERLLRALAVLVRRQGGG